MIGTTPDLHEDALAQTVAALEAGPTTLTPDTALAIIDQWHGAAVAESEIDLGAVASGLAALRGLLSTDGPFDGGAIGDVLLQLGEATQAVAAQARDARLTPRLEKLATLLTFGGNRLSGTDATDTSS